MAKRIEKKDFFDTNLGVLTSKDDLRLAMQCLCFKEGYVLATDGHVAIKQKLSLHGIDDESASIMDGRLLHKSVLPSLKKMDSYEVRHDGIVGYKGRTQTKFLFEDGNEVGRFPDIDAVISRNNYELSKVSINPKNLERLDMAMFKEHYDRGIILEFSSEFGLIRVTSSISESDQLGLIMSINYNKL